MTKDEVDPINCGAWLGSMTPPLPKAGLEKLVDEISADEVIVVTDTYEHSDRLRSYELVAEVARELAVAA
jgi:hypothetical protein